jgi:multiple sugar transport system permease protein
MAMTEVTGPSRPAVEMTDFKVAKRSGVSAKQANVITGVLGHAALIVLGLIFLFPFFWMLTTALKPEEQIFAFPPEFWPEEFVWSNYPDAMTFVPFGTYLVNTLIVAFWVVVGTTLSSAIVAYGFAKIRWPGRNILFVIMLSTMMLPYQVTMIPLFTLFAEVGWVGSFLPLTVPAFFGVPFYIFLLRQFFMTIPNDLSDAARLDGASEFRIWWQVILPLTKTALITVALLTFIGSWNEFLQPLIYLNDESRYTISLGLQQFLGQYATRWGMLMAGATIATLPILVLYFFAQRTFVSGISTTGIKG